MISILAGGTDPCQWLGLGFVVGVALGLFIGELQVRSAVDLRHFLPPRMPNGHTQHEAPSIKALAARTLLEAAARRRLETVGDEEAGIAEQCYDRLWVAICGLNAAIVESPETPAFKIRAAMPDPPDDPTPEVLS